MPRYTFTPHPNDPMQVGVPVRTVEIPAAERVPATVRPDWKMPEPPPGGDWHAAVAWVGDGWEAHWRDDNGECPDNPLIVGDDGWPFVEDFARASDWEAIGWEVV